MGKGLTATEKQKYEQMVRERFNPLMDEAELRLMPLKEELRRQVKSEWQIYEMERQIDEAERVLKELKEILASRLRFSPDTLYFKSKICEAIDVEVNHRLRNHPSNILGQICSAKKEALEAIWLADAPAAVVDLLKSLSTGVIADLKLALNAQNTALLEAV